MTVQELIEKLSELPPNTRVMVDGMYADYDELLSIEPVRVKPFPGASFWEDSEDGEKAICLPRHSGP